MGAQGRFLIGEAEDKDCAASFAVEASVFVQRHRLYSYCAQRPCCVPGEDAVRNETRIDRAGQRQRAHRLGAGIQQSLGTLIESRAGRKDVINEKEPAPDDLVWHTDRKGLSEISQSLMPRERCLRIGRQHADKMG